MVIDTVSRSIAYSVDIPRCWCDCVGVVRMITLTEQVEISIWIMFIVVLCVVLHAPHGVSMSSRIWVTKRLSNNITDSGAP